jgi:hypothetical protein
MPWETTITAMGAIIWPWTGPISVFHRASRTFSELGMASTQIVKPILEISFHLK